MPTMRRNPITVRRGHVREGFMNMEHVDIERIDVTNAAGQVVASAFLREDGLLDLIEVPKEHRGVTVLVPLLHAVKRRAKKQHLTTILADVCWWGIYRIVVRAFGEPIYAKYNGPAFRIARARGLPDDDWMPSIRFDPAKHTIPVDGDEFFKNHYVEGPAGTGQEIRDGILESSAKWTPGNVISDGIELFVVLPGHHVKRLWGVERGYVGNDDGKTTRSALVTTKEWVPHAIDDYVRPVLAKKSPLDAAKLKMDKVSMVRLWWKL